MKQTPFYAESGGQVGDVGFIVGDNGRFEVADTQKDGGVFVHHGRMVEGQISVGDSVKAEVDVAHRDGIRRAHSATHILHYALQQTLGKHAQQRGSKVSQDHLRFDFANMEPVSSEQLATIETQTIERINSAVPIKAQTLPLEEARSQGAMMLFGEKYPDPVRMVSIGEFSKELCGGIHLDNSGEVEAFEITVEENVSAGTRRIQALTGEKARLNQEKIQAAAASISKQLDCGLLDIPSSVSVLFSQVKELRKQVASGKKSKPKSEGTNSKPNPNTDPTYLEVRDAIRTTAQSLNTSVVEVADRVVSMKSEIESLNLQLEKLSDAGKVDADELIAEAELVGEIRVIAKELPGANMGLMRQLIDQIRKKTNPAAIVFLSSPEPGKVILANGLTNDLVEAGWNAGKWIGEVAAAVGGRGGGKPDMATAGGKEDQKIPDAIQIAVEFVKSNS